MSIEIAESVRARLSEAEIKELEKAALEFQEFVKANPPKWYAPFCWFQHFPRLRLLVFNPTKASVCAVPMTKKHLFDLLRPNHPGRWTPRYVGFQLWY